MMMISDIPNAVPWESDEDVYLCRAYLNVSDDGATSTDQTSKLFWDRILHAFESLAGSDGPSRNVDHYYSTFNNSNLIHAVYWDIKAKAEVHSGWTDEDYAAEAGNRFTAKREQLNANALAAYEEAKKYGTAKKKSKPRVKPELFRFMHCFEILKMGVQFMREIPQPRKRPRSLQNSFLDSQGEMQDRDQAEIDVSAEATNDDMFDAEDVLLSPTPSSQHLSIPGRPSSAGKKKAKQLQPDEQVDKAMMHSQKALAEATSAQVDIMQQQLEVAQKKLSILEAQQQTLRDQAEMSLMCTPTEGLAEFGQEYLCIKQRQLLEKLKQLDN
ncbi:hypothetical protein PF010_g8820 [Phytophthora fragariae]|uniref:No apical meristem-associated C-terminal domain-containing protein n=1 Tax=Phytophthora fragariae TaxID=53985 RepID=A0A6G0LDD4_9STRA|nr:hypothetical protein PF010_g8820 [Phytophthora fragariae]